MSYLVSCTFDLKNASAQDYRDAYSDLATIGLRKVVAADNGTKVVVPTTMVIGEFNGQSAGAVRDYARNEVQRLFRLRRFSSEIFVAVGGDWSWGAATT